MNKKRKTYTYVVTIERPLSPQLKLAIVSKDGVVRGGMDDSAIPEVTLCGGDGRKWHEDARKSLYQN